MSHSFLAIVLLAELAIRYVYIQIHDLDVVSEKC